MENLVLTLRGSSIKVRSNESLKNRFNSWKLISINLTRVTAKIKVDGFFF